jgi:hypothetical protein
MSVHVEAITIADKPTIQALELPAMTVLIG